VLHLQLNDFILNV